MQLEILDAESKCSKLNSGVFIYEQMTGVLWRGYWFALLGLSGTASQHLQHLDNEMHGFPICIPIGYPIVLKTGAKRLPSALISVPMDPEKKTAYSAVRVVAAIFMK